MQANPVQGGPSVLSILVLILVFVIAAIVIAIYRYNLNHPHIEGDKSRGSIGYGFLSFFVPIVGFVLFLVWREKEPGNSKVSGIGALIGLIFWSVVPTVVYLLVFNAILHY